MFVTTSDSTSDSKKLHSAMVRMREKVVELDAAIRAIRKSEAYRKIANIEDLDKYFSDVRAELEDELKRLETDD